jgi:hypothetical protein
MRFSKTLDAARWSFPVARHASGTDDADDPDGAAGGEADGQVFMIEYESAAGDYSVRAITVRSWKHDRQGRARLCAYCHERRAYREFVCERIIACIDLDGEVHDSRDFLLSALGLDIDKPGPVADIDTAKMKEAKRFSRPAAVILAALSRSDGYMHPDEQVIADVYLERLCASYQLSPDEAAALRGRFRRLKPITSDLDEALDAMRNRPPGEKTALLVTAKELIEADGKVMKEECALFGDIYFELTGLEFDGWGRAAVS